MKKTTPEQPITVPPVIAALATFASCDERVSPEFVQAWQQAPAICAQILKGEGESVKGATKWGCIDALVERRLHAVHKKDSRRAKFLATYESIKATDPDTITDFAVLAGEPAFQTGIAVGLYLLSVGLRREGGAR